MPPTDPVTNNDQPSPEGNGVQSVGSTPLDPQVTQSIDSSPNASLLINEGVTTPLSPPSATDTFQSVAPQQNVGSVGVVPPQENVAPQVGVTMSNPSSPNTENVVSPPGIGAQTTFPNSNSGAIASDENPDKNYLVALVLSWLFGSLGVDRIYLGKIGTGILKLVTLGGLSIWALVDFLLIAFGKLLAKGDNRKLEGYAKNRHWVKIVIIVVAIVWVIGVILLIVFFALAATHGGLHSTSVQTNPGTSFTITNGSASFGP